jgi:hypothetical protein
MKNAGGVSLIMLKQSSNDSLILPEFRQKNLLWPAGKLGSTYFTDKIFIYI